MAQSVQLPRNVSNSVCIHLQDGEIPRSLHEATVMFSKYGDVARIDATVCPLVGLIYVTYFDVRVALKVVQQFSNQRAVFSSPAPYDFRAVSIPTSEFHQLPATFEGFQSFGDIAGVSVCGKDMVVEYYDFRAAQQVAMMVPGSRPKKLSSEEAEASGLGGEESTSALRSFGETDWVKETLTSNLGTTHLEEEMARIPYPSFASYGGEPPHLQRPQLAPRNAKAASRKEPAASRAQGASERGPNKPVREKVKSQDLSKFEIVPEKIRSGEDDRTTVMVRNIPKACSREAFVELLTPIGLADRYTFFYMPFDKRRNIHCGFAFINFRTPQDVLTLFELMSESLWRSIEQEVDMTHFSSPAVSYARLQGQDQLMKHFSLSAVMHDSDARKRPMFCQQTQASGMSKDFFYVEPGVQDTIGDMHPSSSAEPFYWPGGKDLGRDESLAFLMSGASGA
eukprot:TRINITY_DN12047_c0_g1_i1.p1 TRINITY_DN12047_c0_g1~~TRINITY_DN12047_c0_g1_i1.p1  ORF type:complete len:452 (+),score=92.98 TRINITY_DN12047_c0_g1_i1:197-1552(+)